MRRKNNLRLGAYCLVVVMGLPNVGFTARATTAPVDHMVVDANVASLMDADLACNPQDRQLTEEERATIRAKWDEAVDSWKQIAVSKIMDLIAIGVGGSAFGFPVDFTLGALYLDAMVSLADYMARLTDAYGLQLAANIYTAKLLAMYGGGVDPGHFYIDVVWSGGSGGGGEGPFFTYGDSDYFYGLGAACDSNWDCPDDLFCSAARYNPLDAFSPGSCLGGEPREAS